MKFKEIYRTSTFAWSPSGNVPLLATGTVAGALDENFSNDSRLEIWEPNFLDVHEYALGGDASQPGPKASLTTTSRFNRLIWGYTDNAKPLGVLAAGMESGELAVWNAEQILSGADSAECLSFRNSTHAGPVRGLDFNPVQKNLLASGGTNGEIFIWDLNNPATPYAPGTRSARLDEITATAWNTRTAHILATSSSTGYTVVWDLRAKRETLTLAYIGGASTAGNAMNIGSMAMGNRRGMSDVCWHPDGFTRMVTASDDDISPIVMCWDLRNSRAPEKILTGHEKGVLSLSWCKQDADLLLSCGKDNRVLCWNPQSGEVIGEVPPANNWAFQVDWCPRNPDLFAAAFFDGTIGVHSIQTINEEDAATTTLPDDGASLFDNPAFGNAGQASLSLKQPPKWLSRPASATFGYGGRLVTVGNLPNAQGRHQSSAVRIHTVVTEESIIHRAQKLQSAVQEEKLDNFAQEKTSQATQNSEDYESWKALLSLFQSNSNDELITLFGFSKENIASQVAEAVAKVKASAAAAAAASKLEEDDMGTPHEPVVTFAETDNVVPPWEGAENPEVPQNGGGAQTSEATPSELSTSATSDGTKAADIESTTTEHSLFADDLLAGTPQAEAGADFFSSMGPIRAIPPHLQVPHTNYAQDSSVAATIGSGPSSVASETLKNNNFSIYPADTSDLDRLLTKALVLGDFDSAVSLCIASDRFADAILLAVKGGEELLQKTQKAYFERQTATLPYLRLFESIVSDDLEDIVQNADLQEWQEIFVVLCTFSKKEEFSMLMEQLGQRLEFQGNIVRTSELIDDAEVKAQEFKKHATLCYLAAQKLEKIVNIWIEEMCQEEDILRQHVDRLPADASRYTVHAQALQTFIEKVTVFRAAAHYVDVDLNQASSDDAAEKTYRLSSLYDRYFEYADLLVSQGLIDEAVKYLAYTPADYKGAPGSGMEFDVARERVLQAAGKSTALPTPKPAAAVPAPSAPAVASTSYTQNQNYSSPYGAPYIPPQQQPQAPVVQARAPTSSNYGPYNPPVNMQPQTANSNTYAPQNQGAPAPSSQPYGGGYGYGGGGQGYVQPASISQTLPPPPPPVVSGPGSTLPPPQRNTVKRAQGWNDAPPIASDKRNAHNHSASKPVPLTTPFANAPPPAGPMTPLSPYMQNPQSHPLPPPPRAGASTPQRGGLQPSGPPPPRGPSAPPTQMPPPPTGHGHLPPSSQFIPPGRPGSGGPGQQYVHPPPNRILSPPQGGPPPRPMSGAPQFANPPPPPPAAAAAAVVGGMAGIGRGTPPPPSSQMPYAPPVRAAPPQQLQGGRPGFAPGPPPGQGMGPPPPQLAPSGPYAPSVNAIPRPGPSGMQGPPLSGPPPGAGGPATTSAPPPVAPPKAAPPKSKYPPGDRSHIPDSSKPAFEFLSVEMNRMKQQTPPQQKRLVDDTERRINSLFDALNCETLSKPVLERLQILINAMISRNRDASMALHVELLTQGSVTDDIGVWMAGVKQLIIRNYLITFVSSLQKYIFIDDSYSVLDDATLSDRDIRVTLFPLMPFGEVVIGPPGSGKTTYAYGKYQLFTALKRPITVVNLDPANDNILYPCPISISSLITLSEVMQTYNLGPNGAMLYCMEYLEANFDWLEEELKKLDDEETYLVFDFPGQVELWTNHESVKRIIGLLTKKLGFRLAAVHLCDSHNVTDAGNYVSALLLSLRTMLQLELPHVNVLSKIDLVGQYGDLAFNLDFYTEVQDLEHLEILLNQNSHPRYASLNMTICSIIEDYALVGFETLAVEDKESMLHLSRVIDKATGAVYLPPSNQPVPENATFNPANASSSKRPNTYSLFSSAAGPMKGPYSDAKNVQERWVDAREEYDAFERVQWRKEGEAVAAQKNREQGEKDKSLGGGSREGVGRELRNKIQIRERI